MTEGQRTPRDVERKFKTATALRRDKKELQKKQEKGIKVGIERSLTKQ